MLRKILTSFVFALTALAAYQNVNAQGVQLDIRNQRYVGTSLYFDVYLVRTSGSVHLGNADFVLTYNHANFSSPTLNYENGTSVLKNSSGGTISYGANLATTIGTSGANANRLIINLAGPTFSNQTQFNANVARIDSAAQTHLLGTFYITGATNTSAAGNLAWVTAGGGTRTQLFTHAVSTPWKSTRINSVTANDPTLTTEPGTQVSGLNVSGKTDTTFTLSWNRGNGDSIIILAKSGSAVGSNLPADGFRYTAGNFSEGDEIGSSGVYVVYKGVDTFATIDGFTANTTYHFAALEFSGTGGYQENYNTTSADTVSGTTNSGEPTSVASGFSVTAFTTTSLTIDFTSGNGANRIIIVREGSAPSSGPVDATTYTADADFSGSGAALGGGKVVYSGNDGAPLTVTGLTPGMEYYFEIYEYNGTGGTENYMTTALSGDRSTLQSEPTTASTGGSFSGLTPTSLTLSWNKGNGAAQIVVVREGAAVNADPADGRSYTADASMPFTADSIAAGNYVVYVGTDTFVTLTGLNPNTTYHYEVFEVNGTGESANYLTSPTLVGNRTTLVAEPTVASSGFNITHYSTSSLAFEFSAGNGTNRIIVARKGSAVNADPLDGSSYTANSTFGAGDSIGTGMFVVYNGSADSVGITGLDPNTEYFFEVFEYSGSAGAQNYLVSSTLTGDRYTLQNEPTTASSGGASSGVTTTSITFSWNKGNGASQLVVVRAGSAVNADPTDGVEYTADAAFGSGDTIAAGRYVVYQGTDTFVTVTGLDPNTTYYYEVFEVNGTGTSQNYLNSPTLTGSQVTLEDAPTVQVSNFAVTNTTTNSISLSWTRGNGENVIIIARAINSVSSDPVDGNTYTANNAYGAGSAIGSGYVVYKGTGTSVTVSSLNQDTVYHFAAYEFNGAAGAENFNVSAPATTSDNTNARISITALLEGPMINQTMDTTLNVNGDLPLTNPYTVSPWSYGGTDSVSVIPNANVVDWVYIEIRKADSAGAAVDSTIVDAMVAFILNDGSVVGLDGSSALTSSPSEAGYGKLYAVVYHRNHVGVISSGAMTFSHAANAYVWDFTTGMSQAYGVDPLVLVNGKYAMAAGNADVATSVIGSADRTATWNDRNTFGYKLTDVNMDGSVDAADRSLIFNNTGLDIQIP